MRDLGLWSGWVSRGHERAGSGDKSRVRSITQIMERVENASTACHAFTDTRSTAGSFAERAPVGMRPTRGRLTSPAEARLALATVGVGFLDAAHRLAQSPCVGIRADL